MTITIESLLEKTGQIVTLHTRKTCKVKKGKDPIMKDSIFQCRIGVDYDHIERVKEKRVSGELPKENAGLPWGTWVKFPYLIVHNNRFYLRCTTLKNNVVLKTHYFRDNAEITKDDAKLDCLSSEFSNGKNDNEVFTIAVDSIIEVK